MFNSRSKKVTVLFKAVRECFDEISAGENCKDRIWNMLYEEKPYNDEVMRNLISDLNNLAKRFLIHLRADNEQVEAEKHLIHEFYDRGLNDLVVKEIGRTEKFIHDNYRNVDSRLLDNYILGCIRTVVSHREFEYKDYKFEQERIMSLINYFLKEMMAYYQNYDILKTFIKTEYDMLLFDELMTFADMNYKKLDPEVQLMYNTTIIMIYPQKEDVFEKTLQLVKQKGKKIERFAHYNILIALENYGLNRYNAGNKSYVKKLFEIYEEKVKHDVLTPTPGGAIVESTFTNMIKTAVLNGKYHWAENFLKKNFHKLPDNEEDMFNYYMAYLAQSKGDNEKALQCLSKMKARDMMEKINVRNLELKIFFELGYYDSVLASADSYKHYFSGNKTITESRKKGHRNFVDYLVKILRACEKKDSDALGFLNKQIQETFPIAEKTWLLSKTRDARRETLDV